MDTTFTYNMDETLEELLACAKVMVSVDDLWIVLNQPYDLEKNIPEKVWKARMNLYRAINAVRVERHDR